MIETTKEGCHELWPWACRRVRWWCAPAASASSSWCRRRVTWPDTRSCPTESAAPYSPGSSQNGRRVPKAGWGPPTHSIRQKAGWEYKRWPRVIKRINTHSSEWGGGSKDDLIWFNKYTYLTKWVGGTLKRWLHMIQQIHTASYNELGTLSKDDLIWYNKYTQHHTMCWGRSQKLIAYDTTNTHSIKQWTWDMIHTQFIKNPYSGSRKSVKYVIFNRALSFKS